MKAKETKKSRNVAGKNSGNRNWRDDIRYGRGISLRFFRANFWLILLILVVLLVLIGLRYRTKTRMMEIKQLTRELEQARSNKIEEQAAYMSLIRESEMRRLVEEKHLNLEFQQNPPYEVYTDDKEPRR